MTLLEAFDEAEGVQEVAAKGFVFFWPLKFTFLGRRELPENVGNMFGGVASAGSEKQRSPRSHSLYREVVLRVIPQVPRLLARSRK